MNEMTAFPRHRAEFMHLALQLARRGYGTTSPNLMAA